MIYLIGDTHLRSDEPDLRMGFNGELLYQLIQKMPITGEDTVIQLGDFYDRALSRGSTHKIANTIVSHLCKVATQVFILEGNHGLSSVSGSNLDSLDVYDNLHLIRNIEISMIEGYNIVFCPHVPNLRFGGPYEEVVKSKYISGTAIDLILGHGALKHSAIMDMPYLDLDSVGFEFKYAVFGDIHSPSKDRNRYSIGSTCLNNKGEVHKPIYMTWDGEELRTYEIPTQYYCEFKYLNYPNINDKKIPEKDYRIVKVSCKKEEKFGIEKTIRESVRNLYDIEWEFVEEEKTSLVETCSEEELEKKFFQENKFSKKVVDSVTSYLQKEVE